MKILQKCIILGETVLGKELYWARLYTKMCVLGDICSKMLMNLHEDLKINKSGNLCGKLNSRVEK